MIRISPEDASKLLALGISRGSVLRTKVKLRDDSEAVKRLLIVSLDCNESDICYLFATSKIDFYSRESRIAKIARENAVFVDKGITSIFELPTFIDCREVHTIKRAELVQRLMSRKLNLLGQLPAEILTSIDDKLRKSILISPKVKKRIVSFP